MKNQEGIVRRQIGERIHQRRRELGLSAEALAKRLGVSKSTVGRYEQKGVSPERTGLLISLSEVLDTSFDWLVGGGPAEAGKSVTAYARELDEHIRRALTRIRRSGLEREQEELFVGTMGYFIDYFGVLAGHYGKAVRALDDLEKDAAVQAPLSRYRLGSDDLGGELYRREMLGPVERLKEMADCILHLYGDTAGQYYAALARAADGGRPFDPEKGKGSVRQKGRRWYYRFYMADGSGRMVQREFAGGETRLETEAMLRRAVSDYEHGGIPSSSVTLGKLLDLWVEEELRTSSKSNGTLSLYQGVINRIKQHPLSRRKLRSITPEDLQGYIDYLCASGKETPDGQEPLSVGYIRVYQAVLQSAFRYAVFPGKLLTYNPMQYVARRDKPAQPALFAGEDKKTETITREQFKALCDALEGHPVLLPVQIAYYTGLRLGEVCALTWEDVDFDGHMLTVRRSMRYNGATHRTELGTTKRAKIRSVAFGETLDKILRAAKAADGAAEEAGGERYRNYYKLFIDKGRSHYGLFTLEAGETLLEGYNLLDFVCKREDGSFTAPDLVEKTCRKLSREIPELRRFHFHMLRHTYTSNLLSSGASPKDVQELLGHSDVSTTMNVYAHSSEEAKLSSARLLDELDKEDGPESPKGEPEKKEEG